MSVPAKNATKRPGSYRLLSFRGVNLYLHISLLFLLFYVVFVAAIQFPLVVRQAGVNSNQLFFSPGVWGLIFAVGLFVSVALHEFAHALTAQAMKIPVRGITLMMLGGVSELGNVPEKKFAEFKLAIVGPLASLALALVLGWIYRTSSNSNIIFMSYWLSSVNFMLAIFNMVPAFPLDGGRVLRSLLASRMGSVKATRISVSVSKGIAWALGIMGLVTLNLLLVVIAFFIYASGQGELAMLFARGALRGMRVRDIAFRVDGISGKASLKEAADQMMKLRTPILPVQANGREGKVLSLPGMIRIPRNQWGEIHVDQIAESTPVQLDANAPLSSALQDISDAPARALPVTDEGNVVGVIRASDVSDLLQLRAGDEDLVAPSRRDRAA